MICASEIKNVSIVQALIEHGADLNINTKNGHNAIWYAQKSGCQAVIRILNSYSSKGLNW